LKGEDVDNGKKDEHLGEKSILKLTENPSLTPAMFEHRWKSIPER